MIEDKLTIDAEKIIARHKVELTGKDIVHLVFCIYYVQKTLEENEHEAEKYYEKLMQKLIKTYNRKGIKHD